MDKLIFILLLLSGCAHLNKGSDELTVDPVETDPLCTDFQVDCDDPQLGS